MSDRWWTDGSMVNTGLPGDEGFVADAATRDDAQRIADAHNRTDNATVLPTSALASRTENLLSNLPIRIVMDEHGHYWRDYGDHWSMCPVSEENIATEPIAEFYPLDAAPAAEPVPLTLDEVEARVEAAYKTGFMDGSNQAAMRIGAAIARFAAPHLPAALASPDKGEPRP